jgi:hypothetical protein
MTAVGADIESICAKCGDVWHVVVAVVGTKVAKVQCKQCGGYHRHKSPADAKAAAAGKRVRKPAASRAEAPSKAPPKPVIDPEKPVRPYRMSEAFAPGDQIQHLRFGVGVVENASEPGKINVLFDEGRKVLAAAKGDAQLATANDLQRARARAGGDAAGE